MKSSIRIELRKPQATRHVCPTSSRPTVFKYDCRSDYRVVLVRAYSWLKKLVADATRDGAGEDAWQAPHHVTIRLIVSDMAGTELAEHHVSATLTCSQTVLLARYLSRFDEVVSFRKRVKDLPEWDLLPYRLISLKPPVEGT